LEIFLIAYPMPLALQGFYGLSLYAYIAPITIYSLLSSYGLVCKSCSFPTHSESHENGSLVRNIGVLLRFLV